MGIFDFFKPNVEKMEKKRDVEGLIKALKNETRIVRWSAAEALGETGKPAVEPLKKALMDEDVRNEAKEALEKMGDSVIEPMTNMESQNNLIRKPNIERFEANKDVEGLIKALKYKDADVRWEAAMALGKIGDERAVEPLIQALREDKDVPVRALASGALGMIRDKRAVEPLIQALINEDMDVRKLAAEALGKIGKPAVESLLQLLKDEDKLVQGLAAGGLIEVRDINALELLIQALKDEDSFVRGIAATTLIMIGKPAVEPLIQALINEDKFVRENAAKALGEIRDPRAVKSLTDALKDEDNNVRTVAEEALEKIK